MKRVILDGNSLTLEQLRAVACDGAEVELSKQAMDEVRKAREIVLELANSEKQIYGLNTGVGANKDNRVTEEEFHRFNERILFSHAVALPPYADTKTARATMLCRLNSMMTGLSGVSPEIPELLRDMLNCGIHPRIPQRGSVGMADLGSMAYVGLALIGKGTVELHGREMPACTALAQCALKPVSLGPKDGLPLVSNNSLALAKAALLYGEIEDAVSMSEAVYALCLEAQEYNPMFLDRRMLRKRPFTGNEKSLEHICACLQGSSFWDNGVETLYGALSFKSSPAIYGTMRDALESVKPLLLRHLNAAEDCPIVLIPEREMISADNFIITGLAVEFEKLGIMLAHLSGLICNRILRMDQEAFSGLPRFLRPADDVIGYATMQKTISALDSEIQLLAAPVSFRYLPTSNDSEDHGCNTPLVMQKTEQILDLLYYLIGIEAMHGAQAADLKSRPSGKGTRKVYDALRSVVPFLEEDDRDLGEDMRAAHDLVQQKRFLVE